MSARGPIGRRIAKYLAALELCVPSALLRSGYRSIIEIDVADRVCLRGGFWLAAHDRPLHPDDTAVEIDIRPANRDQF